MGFLAPLYALAALAIVGPIVFHLIQRQPRGQKVFSSLMFLSPSPPTLTRRSRLDNLLLLLLRALAIGLIAFAFARPYWRSNSMLNASLEGRRMAVLLDTSASMQRPDVWQSAIETVRELLTELSPEDRVALYTIDSRLGTVVPLEEEPTGPANESVQSVTAAINDLQPSWRSGELATGIKQIADTMTAAMLTGNEEDPLENLIVLVSDLHEESGLDGLQGYPWPENVRLDVRQIQPAVPGNARVTLVRDDDDGPGGAGDAIKVRVENNGDSQTQAFQLVWQNAQGGLASSGSRAEPATAPEAIQVQVTAGQARVFPVGNQPVGADRLVLLGDAWEGDNELLLAAPEPTEGTVAFIGPERRQPEDQLDYFLAQAPLGTPFRRRQVERLQPAAFDPNDPTVDALIYQPTDEPDSFAETIRNYVERGGTAVVVLAEPLASPSASSIPALLQRLTGNRQLTVSEAKTRSFALLSKLEYSHPVFAPFADPRFNDFSKIRFWSHRRLEGLDSQAKPEAGEGSKGSSRDEPGAQTMPTLRVIASFDDQTPFLIEQAIGRGRLWIATAGWQPSASTLALSSKFVPILLQMLDPQGMSQSLDRGFEVGEAIHVAEMFGASDINVLQADGKPATAEEHTLEAGWLTFDRPGLFRVVGDDNQTRPIAVHVPLRESQLEPLDLAVFDQYGIALGKLASDVQRRDTERQRSAVELENQQRIWQWLVAIGLVILAAETVLAGWTARQKVPSLSVAK